jgi:hypothetical protein
MESSPLPSARTRRPGPWNWHLLALAFTAPLAVWVGFIGTPVRQAELLVNRGAHPVIGVLVALFMVALGQSWRTRRPAASPLTRREAWTVGLVIAGFSWLAFIAEPLRAKVLNDEFVLQSTAFNLHFFREAGTMVRGYDIGGVFLSLDNYIDKRPLLYPFLVSLAHDLTGYRVLNAFLVNVALLPVLLGLAWWLARRLAGPRAGLIAVALLGSLPLLAQNATGAGMELTNALMILAAAALAIQYLERPDGPRLSAFALALVLLCQARYESAIFVPAGALVVILGWWREKRLVLSWSAVIAPLLLIPFALQHKVLANTPVLWELTEEKNTRFSVGYVPDNLRRAADFFLSTDPDQSNSWLLTGAGVVGLGWLLVQLIRHHGRKLADWPPAALAVGPFAAAIAANLALVMAYYWAGLNDPMASRFALPACLLLAVLAAVAFARMDAGGRLARVVLAATVMFTLGVAVPRMARHGYSNLGIQEHAWVLRAVAARGEGPRLVITNKTSIVWLLEKTPSVLIQRARLAQDRLRLQLTQNNVREILLTQELRPASALGQHQIIPEDVVPASFHLETVAEKRFGTKLVRISRVVAIDPPPSKAPAGPKVS